MAVPDSLVIASEVIGFLSFGFTLLTWLGVYVDLLKTLRSAPSTIPIALGNLREEIRYEQVLCKQKLETNDPFHVLPGRRPGRKDRYEVLRLMSDTLRHIWRDFCDIERRFLMEGRRIGDGNNNNNNNGGQDYVDSGDDDYDDDDNNEKTTRRRRGANGSRPRLTPKQSFIKGRMGLVEAGLSRDRQTYYATDLAHRFKWWWRKDDVSYLAMQVQRIQIRRIERDAFETSILVKRGLKMFGRISGEDVYSDSDDGPESDGDYRGNGNGGGGRRGGGGGTGGTGAPRVHRRRHSGVQSSRAHRRRKSRDDSTFHGGIREVSEKEVLRRRAPSPVRSSPPPPPRPPPSVVDANRREQPRRGSVIYEYEIINPGGVHVEYGSPLRGQGGWREGRQRQRPRSQSRNQSRSQSRSRSRRREDDRGNRD